MGASVRLRMEDVTKRFGDSLALDGVTFEVRVGELHALLGENGAGKTTLMNVLSGLYRADSGRIWLDGRRVEIASPRDAVRRRIGMVHQHFELIPALTGLENVVVGRETSRWWFRRDREAGAVEALARRFGFTVALDVPVGALPVADQQKVEILKAIVRGVDVLILDEPTTVLTPQESDHLLATVRAMADEGLAVVFISHRIREVLEHCDRVTVMRGGRVAGSLATAEATEAGLVELMIGERLARLESAGPRPAGEASALRVEGLTVAGRGAVPAVRNAGFSVRRGEIVGIAGVAGNGQQELCEAIVGLRLAVGRVELDGRDVTGVRVGERLDRGLLYIPEDRMADGILPTLSVAENLVLGLHRHVFTGPLGYDPERVVAMAAAPIAEYRIAPPSPTAIAGLLSGGNIQKILIARALALGARTGTALLLAHNPSRGLDIRTTTFVRRCLLEASRAGAGVLLVSSDLDELLQIADRILVMFHGALVADLSAEAFDPYRIGRLMAGGDIG